MAQPPRSFMRLQWRLHKLLWNLSAGRMGRKVGGMPVLELVTTGHRSGEQRSVLLFYLDLPEGSAGPMQSGRVSWTGRNTPPPGSR